MTSIKNYHKKRRGIKKIATLAYYKQLVEALKSQLMHDPLTGIGNRTLIQKEIERALAISQRTNDSFALIVLDIDKFKQVNDTHGHLIGDELLKVVANKLVLSLRASDAVARIGGDEFVILVNNLHTNEEVIAIAKKLMHIFERPLVLNNQLIEVHLSIGISIYSKGQAIDYKSLLEQADNALYRAKQSGRNSYKIYNQN